MFRMEALENRQRSWRGRAILLPDIPIWIMTGLCVLFFITFLVFIMVGTYTRRINVTGEVTSSPGPARIYSGVQGTVVQQFVSQGALINKGAPVYRIDVSKSTSRGVVSDNQRKDIENQLLRVGDIISRLEASKQTTLHMLEKQKSQYSEALSRSSAIVKRAEEGIGIMKNNMDNYRRYQSRGLINKDQLTNQVSLYYQQQNNLLGLSGQNEQNALQITSLESQIQTQAAEFDNRIYQMELQRYELHKELSGTDAGGEVIVRALTDGIIDSLSVTVGQMVSVGDSLFQVIPQKVDTYDLVLWVPNDSVPYITPGDRLNVRYEAFPSGKFGQFAAVVETVSKIPASPQEMMTYQGAPKNIQAAVPWYKVVVRPKMQAIAYGEKVLPLENGMKAQSTLFLEKRKIYQWILSPLYDVKHSAAGPVHG